MANPILIVCPECNKQIKAPDNVLGKKVRCKFCQAAFVASKGGADKASTGKPAKPPAGKPAKPPAGKPAEKPPAGKPAKPSVDDDEEDDNPYGMIDVNLSARCPNCANEMESEDSILCLICGYNTQTRQQFQTRKIHALTGGQHFVWLLPGIACALVVCLVVGFNIWYLMKIDELLGNEDSWYLFMWAHSGIKLWVVLMSIFAVYLTGKFAIKRLILHPKPPEVEKKK